MIEVSLNFQELHCIQQYDNGGPSEPYMWIIFFHADNSTIQNSTGVVATQNMMAGISCRGIFEENVKPGKTIPIPPQLGKFTFIVDEEGFPAPVIGSVYAVLEENGTTDSLMRTGHRVFGEAFHQEINQHVANNLTDPTLTDDQKKKMGERIEDKVFSAVRSEAGVLEYFRSKDTVIGFNSEYFSWPLLSLILDRSNGNPYPLSKTVRKDRKVVLNLGQTGSRIIDVVDEYEIRGTITVRRYTPPQPQPCQSERNTLNSLTQQVKDLKENLRQLQTEFAQAPGPQKAGFAAQIKLLRKELSDAITAAERAQEAYKKCLDRNRNSTRIHSTDFREIHR